MAHLKFHNVNDAFRKMVQLFADGDLQHPSPIPNEILISKTDTRNGPVLQLMEPVILTFEKPCERVLFNQARDCNPFFHLFESLYMLAGRNEMEPLAYYAPQMKNYSDDGVTQNGAYGYRWRHVDDTRDDPPASQYNGNGTWKDVDQLQVLIQHLKNEPNSRRAVLQMWNVEDDLLKIDPPNKSKDVCCNISVMFSIRQVVDHNTPVRTKVYEYLDMTVINRSNDLVWGMLGANYVHFSFLQEYMAANLGVEVGVYNQMSNNLHIYTENNSGFKYKEWLADKTHDHYLATEPDTTRVCSGRWINESVKPFPLIQDPATFEDELPRFVENSIKHSGTFHVNWKEPFLQSVATPLLWAFELHKKRDYISALNAIKECAADDWRIVGTNWLMKRKLNWEAKERESANAL